MKFSICMASYEMGDYGYRLLDECFGLLLEQTNQDFEIILSDHSDNDKIYQVCMSWSNKLNINYIRNFYGKGSSAPNLNRSMSMAKGEIILLLFQDDYLINKKTLELIDKKTKNKKFRWGKVGFTHTDENQIFYNPLAPKFEFNSLLRGINTMGNQSGIFIAKDAALEFDENIFMMLDCDYCIRLFLEFGPPLIISESCVSVRMHSVMASRNMPETFKLNDELSYLYKKYRLNYANFQWDDSYKIIDVVIPLYNCEKFISEAIYSVLNQTYPVNKIIVVDDESTDGSARIVEDLAATYSNLILIKRKHEGRSSARNAGISYSKAEYIAFLDSDDAWDERKLEKQMDIFSMNNAIDVVYSNYEVIDAHSKSISHHVIEPNLRGDIFEGILHQNLVSGSASAVIVCAKALTDVGGFDENLDFGEDWDLWLRLAKKYKFDFVSDPIVKIRRLPPLGYNKYAMNIRYNRQLLKVWSKWPNEVLKRNDILNAINEFFISRSMRPVQRLSQRITYYKIADKNYKESLNTQIYNKTGMKRIGLNNLFIILIKSQYIFFKIKLKDVLKKTYHRYKHRFNLLLMHLKKTYYHGVRH